MELLDIGEIQEIIVTVAGPPCCCEIEVRGSCGSQRYDTECAISRNRFEKGSVILWDARLQFLLTEWTKCENDNKRIFSEGERISLPSTKESMEWCVGDINHSLIMLIFEDLKFGRLTWVDVHGNKCPIPKGAKAMICVIALNVLQNERRTRVAKLGAGCYDRIENEFAVAKLVMDVYADNVIEGAISGDA